jgi:two-component system, cell cycle response regulator
METATISILLIEDNPGDARLLRLALQDVTSIVFHVAHASTLQEGMQLLSDAPPDVVLLDLSLPDSHGLETVIALHEYAPEMPVIVLTGNTDDALAVRALQEGAQDYLVKGQFDGGLISRAIRYAIERHRLQQAVRSLSLTDELTGLYNRRGFLTFAEQHRKVAARSGRGFLLVFLDIDGLKQINDTLGHAEGDAAMLATAEVLRRTFRDSDIIARMGGDEFAVIAFESDDANVQTVEARLQEAATRYNAENILTFRLSLSVGVEPFSPTFPVGMESLLAHADQRMYAAKRAHYARGPLDILPLR